jgi:hypothetical protein
MSSIVKNKVGKYTYLYESESYRDGDGKPQTRKTSIGKIDYKTGETIYKPEYLERVQGTEKQPEISNAKMYSINDIKSSTIRELGVFHLLESISKEVGLLDVLKVSLPDTWEQIATLAFYMVATGEPAMYCEDWLVKSEGLSCGNMSPQKISMLLSAISDTERMSFYENWGQLRGELEYMALDITSISSYSEFIGDVELGYNRDKEKLPQINVCMLFGEKSQLPVFQTTYSGSLKDVSTLKSTLQIASGLKLNNISIVMDKGFCSKGNIDDMLADEDGIRFLISTPLTMRFTKNQISSEKKDIDSVDNTIVVGDDVIRGVVKNRAWDGLHMLYTHVYNNVELAHQARNKLYGFVAKLKREAKINPTNPKLLPDYEKYLIIRKRNGGSSGYTINIRYDVIEEQLQYTGWLLSAIMSWMQMKPSIFTGQKMSLKKVL